LIIIFVDLDVNSSKGDDVSIPLCLEFGNTSTKKYGVVPLTHLNSAVLILVFVNMILLWPTIGMAISISVGCMEKWWAWTFAFQKEENSFIESARV